MLILRTKDSITYTSDYVTHTIKDNSSKDGFKTGRITAVSIQRKKVTMQIICNIAVTLTLTKHYLLHENYVIF